MNNILMTIYRDSTGLFTRQECDLDNEFDTYVPYDTMFEYFIEKVKDNFPAADPKEGVTDKGLFEEWLDEYTMDATMDLYDYCKDKGIELTEYKGSLRVYSYDIWEGDKGIITANNWVEAVEAFRESYDCPIAEVDGVDYDSGVCQLNWVGVCDRPKLMFLYN